MTDYKRMVSYMYQYENGIKKKNVGYVRVEVKNGQCKFTIHMQLLGQSDSIFPTYLIHREGSSLDLIYLGDSILKMQLMDSRLITNEANIMNSGYSLAQMSGVLIFMNNNIFFATVWDNKTLNADELLEAMKPRDKKNVKQIINDGASKLAMNSSVRDFPVEDKEVIKTKIDASIKGFNSESKEGTQTKKEEKDSSGYERQAPKDEPMEEPDAYDEKLSLEEELRIPTYKLPGGLKTIEMFRRSMAVADKIYGSGTNEGEERKANPDAIPAAASNISQAAEEVNLIAADYVQNEKDTAVIEADEPAADRVTENEKADIGADNKRSEITSDSKAFETGFDNKISEAEVDNKTSDVGADIKNNIDLDRLMARFNRLYPFEDNEILLCVKIEPKDIGILPKQLWPLSSNSFLLHGYYCYHHLILAKKKYKDKAVYILGVPGLYQHREQFMARMFGFDCFKSIKKREPKKGDFGYWYLQINC